MENLTPELYEAFVIELEQRWSTETEILASILERIDALLLVTLNANGAKIKAKPLRVERPGRMAKSQKPEAVSFREYVQHTML